MKQKIYTLFIGLFLIFVGTTALAQSVSGTVKAEEDELGIPGVSVVVKGTNRATITDLDGRFTLEAKSGETILFSLIGYLAQEVAVTQTTVIDVLMKNDTKQLGEVVVTALGIKEEQRKLGYNVQQVSGEELVATQRDNFFDALQGRVSGLMVATTSGAVGSSSMLQLRGASSIGGSNQPLIVVDGLPIDNTTFGQGALFTDQPNRQNDYANRASDINPNDIASVTVLKGPEAAALYGSQGSSGAIVITTKKGTKGRGKVNYDNSFGFDNVFRLPKIQNTFIRGFNGAYDPDALSYFGPAKTDTLTTYDNINNYFTIGKRQAHNLSFESGSDRLSYRLAANYTKRDGTVPNNGSTVFSVRMSGTARLIDNLEATTSIAFSSSDLRKVPTGDGGYLINLLRWPSYSDVRNYLNTDGTPIRLQNIGASEFNNPYLGPNFVTIQDRNRRIQSNLGLTWTVAPWLSIVGRVGADSYTTIGNYFNPAAVRAPALNNTSSPGLGFIENFNENSMLLNGNLFAIAKKKISDFDLSLTAGSAIDDRNYEVVGTFAERPYDPTFNSLNNFDPVTMRTKQSIKQARLLGLFGKLDLGYKDMFFISATGRNDWSSTLPIANRSYFYPSVSASFEFSQLLKDVSWLSYGKLRAAYAKSGKDAPPFLVQPALAAQGSTGGGFIYGVFGGNPNLQPEFVTSREVGVEMRFFKSRMKVDVSYFSNERTKQIVSQRLSYGTGFILGLLNGGSFGVNGWEAQIGITPIKNKNITWDITTNFTKNKTNVIDLPADVTEYYNSDTWLIGNARASAFLPIEKLRSSYSTLNLDYNVIGAGTATALGGYSYLRNQKGEVLVSPSTGLPIVNTNFLPIGDRQPDFTVGILNSFTWRGLGFRFNLDLRKGGDVFNGNELYLFRIGLSNRFLDRTRPYTFKGVLRDGKENSDAPTTNTIQITPQTRSDFYGAFAESDFVEHDINWLRIKDVTLSYQLPLSILKRTKNIQGLSFFLTGTDVFMWTNYTGGDPSVNGTTATSGGVGAWGFDFGKIGANRSISFGLRATLQ
jgi:TonB-linked SusC/RagA family outer membrane protein